MNEKEAREIISSSIDHNCFGGCDSEIHELEAAAKGYLEAIEKVKVLEEALKRMDRTTTEALARWEKEK